MLWSRYKMGYVCVYVCVCVCMCVRVCVRACVRAYTWPVDGNKYQFLTFNTKPEREFVYWFALSLLCIIAVRAAMKFMYWTCTIHVSFRNKPFSLRWTASPTSPNFWLVHGSMVTRTLAHHGNLARRKDQQRGKMSGNCRQFATDRNLAQRESQQTGTHLRQVPCFWYTGGSWSWA